MANPDGGHSVYVVDTEFGESFKRKIENSGSKASGDVSFLNKVFSGEELNHAGTREAYELLENCAHSINGNFFYL